MMNFRINTMSFIFFHILKYYIKKASCYADPEGGFIWESMKNRAGVEMTAVMRSTSAKL